MIIKSALPNISEPSTYLTASVAAAGTSLVVANNAGFVANDYIVIGKSGQEGAELHKISTVSGDTTINIAGDAMNLSASINTPVTYIKYNQVKFYMGDWSTRYYTGTIAISKNSATLTGTGTTWSAITTAYALLLNGKWYDIASVDSATQITLTENYTDEDLESAPYALVLFVVQSGSTVAIAPDQEFTLWDDSVTADTPITIKINGEYKIIPITELFELGKCEEKEEKQRLYLNGIEVLAKDGWKKLEYVYRHKVKKPIYRIFTTDSAIKVTGDHSLFQDGKEIKVKDLKIGDKIDVEKLQPIISEEKKISEDMAWLLGFFVAEGHSCWHGSWQWGISQYKKEPLEKCRDILYREYKTLWRIAEYPDGMFRLTPYENYEYYGQYFRDICITSNGDKKVPDIIINSDTEIQKAFFDGFVEGDGHYEHRSISKLESGTDRVLINTKSFVLARGLEQIFTNLGRSIAVSYYNKKNNIFVLRNRVRPDDKRKIGITKIEIDEDFEDFVYDVSTENHTFVAGLGGIIAHNTDAITEDYYRSEYYSTAGSSTKSSIISAAEEEGFSEYALRSLEDQVLSDLRDTDAKRRSRSEIDRDLNDGIRELINTIVSDVQEDYLNTYDTIDFNANRGEYPLFDDFRKLTTVWISYDGSNYKKATAMNISDDVPDAQYDQSYPIYYLRDNVIGIKPEPTGAVTAGAKIWYERRIPSLKYEGDEIPSILRDWKRAIIDYALEKGLLADDQQKASIYGGSFKSSKKDMINTLKDRDLDAVKSIEVVQDADLYY